MNSMPLSSTQSAAPFVNYMNEWGGDGNQLLWQFKSDFRNLNKTSGFIPSHALGMIVDATMQKVGAENIVDIHNHDLDFSDVHPYLRQLMSSSDDLLSCLTASSKLFHLQGSHYKMRAQYTKGEMRLYFGHGLAPSLRGSASLQYLTVLRVISVIRRFLGSEWRPEYLALSSQIEPPKPIVSHTTQNKVISGSSESYVPIKMAHSADIDSLNLPTEIPCSLFRVKQITQSFWRHEEFSIDFIAQLFGVSERTIQRLFSSQGHSFRQFVNTLKFDFAINQLKRGSKVTDVAVLLNYNEPANFTRAIKKHCGLSPSQLLAAEN
ncbi:AraC family transcriptional regulator [Vibrio lamellibrachiae]|uniref:helix-turn-helix domain-containing protein n=1 Tax=Vibrio lamellibrachiae TaxID=2910253 RepID=UPI003D10B5BE